MAQITKHVKKLPSYISRAIYHVLYWSTIPEKDLQIKIALRETAKMIERQHMEAEYIRLKDGMK